MRDIVEKYDARLGNLRGILRLLITQLETHGGERCFIARHVAEFGVHIDFLRQRGGEQVWIKPLEGLTRMCLFTNDVECRHDLANGADVKIAVGVALIFRRHAVGVQQGEEVKTLLALQVLELGYTTEHSAGVALLVTHGAEEDIAFKLGHLTGKFFQQLDEHGVAGFHVESAAAKEVVARFKVGADIFGKFQCAELFTQQIGLVGIRGKGAVVGDADRIKVADGHNGLAAGTFFSAH